MIVTMRIVVVTSKRSVSPVCIYAEFKIRLKDSFSYLFYVGISYASARAQGRTTVLNIL